MRLRRLAGSALMAVGGLCAASFAALGVAVVANYIEPANMADALATVALVTAPGIVAGLAILASGRLIYGGWRSEPPLVRAAQIVLPVAGLLAAAAFCVLLAALLVSGFGPEDTLSAAKHVMGMTAGGAAFLTGRKLRAANSAAERPTPMS